MDNTLLENLRRAREETARQAGTVSFEPDPGPDDSEHDDDAFLTDWERGFMASVESQDYELTDAQQSKLDEITGLIEERRELYRQGRWTPRGD